MNNIFYKTAFLVGLFFLPALSTIAHSEVTPGQFTLMMTAAQKDGGKNFDTLIELMIAAYPEDEVEIKKVAHQIRKENAPVEVVVTKPVIAEPIIVKQIPSAPSVEGTIFSDQGAEKFSRFFLPGWDKDIEINLLYSTGNTRQKSFGTATKFERDLGRFHQTVTSYFDYNSSDSIINKRRYGIAYKSDYSISDISYITGYSSFEGDSFGAFNKRFTLNVGYGLKVLNNDTFTWSVEAGPALLITKPESTEKYITDITAFGSSLISWAINERSELSNETKVYVGNRMVVENKTDYKIKVSGALSGKISYDILYNRDAPLDHKKTDTIARVGILYDF